MSSEMDFDGGLTCTLTVRDLGAARRWYEEILGFRTLYTLEERGWCELATPVSRVALGLSRGEPSGAGGAVLNFGVRDIDAARRQLEGRNVNLTARSFGSQESSRSRPSSMPTETD